jgi:hypothetical protein
MKEWKRWMKRNSRNRWLNEGMKCRRFEKSVENKTLWRFFSWLGKSNRWKDKTWTFLRLNLWRKIEITDCRSEAKVSIFHPQKESEVSRFPSPSWLIPEMLQIRIKVLKTIKVWTSFINH